jgi:CheY-like chemotaxis protein
MTVSEKPARIRIAIAEDDPDFRAALAACLRAAGYLVTETHDGRELLDVLQGTPPGFFKVVIADNRMPRLRGVECLARTRSEAPFVLVSGDDDPDLRARALSGGAAAVLRKPVDFTALLELVHGLLVRELIRKPRAQPDARA